MTNVTKSIIGALLAVVILVGGYFVLQGASGGSNTASVETAISDIAAMGTTGRQGAQGEPVVMNFTNLLKRGGSYKCDVVQDVYGTKTKSTIYISQGKASGQFAIKTKGLSTDTAFILRDGVSYTWNSATPRTGFSFDTTTDVDSKTQSGLPGAYAWDPDQVGDYSCTSWTPDESKFILPDSINFKAVSA